LKCYSITVATTKYFISYHERWRDWPFETAATDSNARCQFLRNIIPADKRG
jgi:hypothetical protein